MDSLFDVVFSFFYTVLTFAVWDVAVWQVAGFALVVHYALLAWRHEKFLRKSFRYEWAYIKAKAMGKNPERRRWGGSFHTNPEVVESGEIIKAPIKKRDEGDCLARQAAEAARANRNRAPELPEQGFYKRR
jgi:hypothetical protein